MFDNTISLELTVDEMRTQTTPRNIRNTRNEVMANSAQSHALVTIFESKINGFSLLIVVVVVVVVALAGSALTCLISLFCSIRCLWQWSANIQTHWINHCIMHAGLYWAQVLAAAAERFAFRFPLICLRRVWCWLPDWLEVWNWMNGLTDWLTVWIRG